MFLDIVHSNFRSITDLREVQALATGIRGYGQEGSGPLLHDLSLEHFCHLGKRGPDSWGHQLENQVLSIPVSPQATALPADAEIQFVLIPLIIHEGYHRSTLFCLHFQRSHFLKVQAPGDGELLLQ